MHNAYPKYVFKGTELMALVRSAEERGLLPDWSDKPGEGFVCPPHPQFQSAHEVLSANLTVSEVVTEDEDDEDEDDEEIKAHVPGVTPKKTYGDDGRILRRHEKKQEYMAQRKRLTELRAKAEQ